MKENTAQRHDRNPVAKKKWFDGRKTRRSSLIVSGKLLPSKNDFKTGAKFLDLLSLHSCLVRYLPLRV